MTCPSPGFFNGEKFTRAQLEHYIKQAFRPEVNLKNGRLTMEICMIDGRWLFYIEQFAPGQFDYTIPDTREQEQRIWKMLKD